MYTPANIDQYLVRNKAHRYLFLKHLKSSALLTSNVILFTRYYGLCNTHFLWKENPKKPEYSTLRKSVLKSVEKQLPKYFSRTHKAHVRQLISLVTEDKLSPTQFDNKFETLVLL